MSSLELAHQRFQVPVRDQAALAHAANDAADLVSFPFLSLCLKDVRGRFNPSLTLSTPNLTLSTPNLQEVARSQLANLKKDLELERSTRANLQSKLSAMRHTWELDHEHVRTTSAITK